MRSGHPYSEEGQTTPMVGALGRRMREARLNARKVQGAHRVMPAAAWGMWEAG